MSCILQWTGLPRKRGLYLEVNASCHWDKREVGGFLELKLLYTIHTFSMARVINIPFSFQIIGTEINLKVQEQLQKAWQVIENNVEEMGKSLFRSLFKADPDLMPRYPFFKDEWNKISYNDYKGTHADQAANTWFIVFRWEKYGRRESPFKGVGRVDSLVQKISMGRGRPRLNLRLGPWIFYCWNSDIRSYIKII